MREVAKAPPSQRHAASCMDVPVRFEPAQLDRSNGVPFSRHEPFHPLHPLGRTRSDQKSVGAVCQCPNLSVRLSAHLWEVESRGLLCSAEIHRAASGPLEDDLSVYFAGYRQAEKSRRPSDPRLVDADKVDPYGRRPISCSGSLGADAEEAIRPSCAVL